MQCMSDTVVCFDLDDTLYKEINFVQSAYGEIAEKVGHPEAVKQMMDWYHVGKNVFAELISAYGLDLTVNDGIKIYRNHFPRIYLDSGIRDFLDELKKSGALFGLITDGRSYSQRNKVNALGIEGLFDIEVISEEFGSEKPDLKNFQVVMDKFPTRNDYLYIGDNPKKDFIAPNQLGWKTFCLLDDGRNIHKQDFTLEDAYMPKYKINNLKDILKYV